MSKHFYFIVSGCIFLGVALMQGFRAYYEYDMSYNGWFVPIWLSWLASMVAFIMAFHAIKNLR